MPARHMKPYLARYQRAKWSVLRFLRMGGPSGVTFARIHGTEAGGMITMNGLVLFGLE